MYNRYEYMESNDCLKQSLARANAGLNWNYCIAAKIDRDLHEKLLKFDNTELIQFVTILPLIRSGYFWTAICFVNSLQLSTDLTEVKTWLVSALTEADDTQVNNTTILLSDG